MSHPGTCQYRRDGDRVRSVRAFQQAAIHFLPVYKGEVVSLIKSTSVVGYIAVQDLTKMSDIIRSRTYDALFPLITTALVYFAVAALLGHLVSRIEIKLQPDRVHRGVKGVKMQ